MSTLVHGGAKSIGPIVGEACGDAHVGGPSATSEWVSRDVETAVGEDVSELGRHLPGQGLLLVHRPDLPGNERRVRGVDVWLSALFGGDGGEEGKEPLPQLSEELVQPAGGHPALEGVKRAVVRLIDGGACHAGHLLLQLKHFLEFRQEQRKIGGSTRRLPRAKCLRLEPRLRLRQLRRLTRFLIEILDGVAHVGTQALVVRKLVNPPAHTVDGSTHRIASRKAVAHLGECRLLRRPRCSRSRRHEALFIVPEDSLHLCERTHLAQQALQVIVREDSSR
mmetsp:Transcript_1643/g.5360  ORF Transcript_1643/g.5360 Transcript_1643/m.5360 type:complete len:279 (+) Transcript_1643:1024-1860(+)